MGLLIHNSNRTEHLGDAAVEVLMQPRRDRCLAPRRVVINSRGMEAWLKQRIATGGGICCRVEFPFVDAFVRGTMERLPGSETGAGAADPFSRSALRWRLLRMVLELAEADEAMAPLGAYLRGQRPDLRAFQIAARLANLFDQYQVFRPDVLAAWDNGERRLGTAAETWQAHVWHRLRREIQVPSRYERVARFAAQAGSLDLADLDPLCLFGITTLPPLFLSFFQHLSRHVNVHLFLFNPCREDWCTDLTDRQRDREANRLTAQGVPVEHQWLPARNPLLLSLGSVGRDFLTELLEQTDYNTADRFEVPEPTTMLRRLQHDICCDLRRRPGPPEPVEGHVAAARRQPVPVEPDDRSVQVHACHGPMREVEVLRDRLLDLLDRDAVLSPRDILVMAPDIGVYAPYIDAVFGVPADDPLHIPYTVADRGLAEGSAAIRGFLDLLSVGRERLRASYVLDLLGVPAIRNAAGISEGAVDLIREWLEAARIRWGSDAEHRSSLGLPALEEVTWRRGLDRLLLGYAIRGDGDGDGTVAAVGGLYPCDVVGAGGGQWLGALDRFVDRLSRLERQLRAPRTTAEWLELLTRVLDEFLQVDDDVSSDTAVLRTVLNGMAEEAAEFGTARPVRIDGLVGWLANALREPRSGAGFFRGRLTFCSMLPMRSIPVRVIWLLGMDDGVVPRPEPRQGIDIMAMAPRRCDRSVRQDDRYLFLEALLSARDVLGISYTGRTVKENTEVPPSPLVSELIDCIGLGSVASDGEPFPPDGPPGLRVVHRLHPFSGVYFNPDLPSLRSFSADNAAAAEARQRSRDSVPASGERPRAESRPLPWPDPDSPLLDLSPERMISMLTSPARFFLLQRLGVRLDRRDDHGAVDRECFDADALAGYQLRDAVTTMVIGGLDRNNCLARLTGQDALPPGTAGKRVFAEVWHDVTTFLARSHGKKGVPALGGLSVAAAIRSRAGERTVVPETLDLGDLRLRLTGSLRGFCADTLLHYRLGSLRPRDGLSAFVSAVWLAAACGEGPPTAVTSLGRKEFLTLSPLEPTAARDLLVRLSRLYADACRAPLPFAPSTSFAYAEAVHKGKGEATAQLAAGRAWHGGRYQPRPGEREDPYHVEAFGEEGPMERAEFADTALAVFAPLLDQREVSTWD